MPFKCREGPSKCSEAGRVQASLHSQCPMTPWPPERPLASRRHPGSSGPDMPDSNRSCPGHRCQGCGQTGLRNTKTNSNLFPFPHKVPDLPHHPHAKKHPAPKSPRLCQSHFQASLNHTHTQPPIPPLGAPKLSLLFPSYGPSLAPSSTSRTCVVPLTWL